MWRESSPSQSTLNRVSFDSLRCIEPPALKAVRLFILQSFWNRFYVCIQMRTNSLEPRMRLLPFFAFTLLFALFSMGQATSPVSSQMVDPGAMDKTVDPCADFFTYSCGGWI